MKNAGKIAMYVALGGAMVFGAWLIKKGYYDKGYSDEAEERLFLVDAVLNVRGIAVNEQNRAILKNVSTKDLMAELGLMKDKEGNYIDLNRDFGEK